MLARAKGLVVIDLMYGLPGQTIETTLEDVRIAESLGIEDLSLYQLKLMPKAPLASLIAGGEAPPMPGMEVVAAFHEAAFGLLDRLGYRQLSAHHYSKRGRDRNVFNRLSMSRSDLLAYGLGAGGRLGGAAFGDTADLPLYLGLVKAGRKPLARFLPPPRRRDLLDPVSVMVLEGAVDRRRLDDLDPALWDLARPLLSQWAGAGLALEDGAGFSLTFPGLFWRGTMESHLRRWLAMNL